jgi:hypothetical protein
MSDVNVWQQFEDWEKSERSEFNMAQDDIAFHLDGKGSFNGQDSSNDARSNGEDSEVEYQNAGVVEAAEEDEGDSEGGVVLPSPDALITASVRVLCLCCLICISS